MCSPRDGDCQKNWFTENSCHFSQQLLVLNGKTVTHHFIFKFLLFDAIQVVKTVKKYGHEVVQIGKPLFFWQSPSRGEHIGVNGFAIAQAVVELRSILSSNFSYSMLFKWLRLSKNKVTKLFKSASRYFSDNLHHVVNALVQTVLP